MQKLCTTLVTCHVTRYKRIPVLLGYTQVIHRILTGYTKVMHTPPPATSCAQGPEGGRGSPANAGRHHTIRYQYFDLAYLDILFYFSHFIGRPRTSTELHRTSTVLPLALGSRNFYHVEQVNLCNPTVTSCCIDSGTSQYGITMLGL